MARVSVIVPVYNAEKYIERCVESLVNQTFADLEIILVDDGSKDASGFVCDRLAEADSRIKVLHCVNAGVSAARNRGIEIASGDYLSFVDSDDWMSLDAYDKMVSLGADVVYCDYAEVYGASVIGHQSYPQGNSKMETIHNMLNAGPRGGNIFNFALVRRELLEKEGFAFPTRFKRGEDFWFAIHCFMSADAIAHSDAVYYYDCDVQSSATHNEVACHDESYLSFMDECVAYVQSKGMWEEYGEKMGWRVLLEKTVWLADPRGFKLFQSVHPEVNCMVDSCPFLGKGMKLLAKSVAADNLLVAKLLLFLNGIRKGIRI